MLVAAQPNAPLFHLCTSLRRPIESLRKMQEGSEMKKIEKTKTRIPRGRHFIVTLRLPITLVQLV